MPIGLIAWQAWPLGSARRGILRGRLLSHSLWYMVSGHSAESVIYHGLHDWLQGRYLFLGDFRRKESRKVEEAIIGNRESE